MRALPVMLVVAALGVPLIPATSLAEDLSDLAAREKERRKGKEAQVFTEEDLKKKDEPGGQQLHKPNEGPKQPDDGDIRIVFNFPLDGDTVYGRVPLNANFYNAFNVDAKFYVNNQPVVRTSDIGNWINGTWDTTTLPAGRYSIRVEAQDQKGTGKKGSATINVTLSKTVPVDPIVASCKKSLAVPATEVFGMNNPFGEDEKAISEMQQLGVKWIRRDFSWHFSELVQGTYDWDYSDMWVRAAHTAGLQILGTPNNAPTWIENVDWPARYTAYQAFMRALVERYKPGGVLSQKEGWKDGYGVSYWELFNEPNDPEQGWDWAPNPARYTLMLAHGAAGARAADPNAFIVYGGMSNVGLAPAGFLEYSYLLGAKDCFDILAHHPYGYMDRFPDLVAKIGTLLSQYGDQNKPIWFTEYGTISDKNRDAEIIKLFEQRGAAPAWFWFGLRDSDEYKWGVLTTDWQKKEPAYKTLKALLSQDQPKKK